MLDSYKTIYQGGQGEITEKKSRFICHIALTKTEEEAQAFIEKIRKQYWDARHNCSAYVLWQERLYTRCNDDKEPSGTAGRPMLDVLLGEEIYNVTAVVTRYFGGVLLGTGGLVRAYSKAVQEGLKNSRIIEKQRGVLLSITTDYPGLGKLQYLVAKQRIPLLDVQYTEKVIGKLFVPISRIGEIEKMITEATGGQAQMLREKEQYLATLDKEYLLFDD